MSPERQSWLFEAHGVGTGGHVRVTIRCGAQDYGRALCGHLTLQPAQWTALKSMLDAGTTALQAIPLWRDTHVEVREHLPDPRTHDP